jgi:hypothetical protein
MSDRKIRNWLRWTHALIGLSLAAYLYTPLHSDPMATMAARWLLVPMLMLTGTMMWQLLNVAKLSDED